MTKLRIINPTEGAAGWGYRVFLDDIQQHNVRRIVVDIPANGLAEVSITYVADVAIDGYVEIAPPRDAA